MDSSFSVELNDSSGQFFFKNFKGNYFYIYELLNHTCTMSLSIELIRSVVSVLISDSEYVRQDFQSKLLVVASSFVVATGSAICHLEVVRGYGGRGGHVACGVSSCFTKLLKNVALFLDFICHASEDMSAAILVFLRLNPQRSVTAMWFMIPIVVSLVGSWADVRTCCHHMQISTSNNFGTSQRADFIIYTGLLSDLFASFIGVGTAIGTITDIASSFSGSEGTSILEYSPLAFYVGLASGVLCAIPKSIVGFCVNITSRGGCGQSYHQTCSSTNNMPTTGSALLSSSSSHASIVNQGDFSSTEDRSCIKAIILNVTCLANYLSLVACVIGFDVSFINDDDQGFSLKLLLITMAVLFVYNIIPNFLVDRDKNNEAVNKANNLLESKGVLTTLCGSDCPCFDEFKSRLCC